MRRAGRLSYRFSMNANSRSRSCTLAGALIAAALSLACSGRAPAAPGETAGDGSPAQTPPPGLRLTLTTDRQIYPPGQPVVLRLEVVNEGGEEIVLRFRSSQRYDFRIQDASGRMIWQWAADRAFMMALGSERLEPGGRLVYEERYDGNPPAGAYSAIGTLTPEDGPFHAMTAFTVGTS